MPVSECIVLVKIAKLLVSLFNVHKMPAILEVMTKQGVLVVGTRGLKVKFDKSLNCKCICTCDAGNVVSWEESFDTDQQSLIDNDVQYNEDVDGK